MREELITEEDVFAVVKTVLKQYWSTSGRERSEIHQLLQWVICIEPGSMSGKEFNAETAKRVDEIHWQREQRRED